MVHGPRVRADQPVRHPRAARQVRGERAAPPAVRGDQPQRGSWSRDPVLTSDWLQVPYGVLLSGGLDSSLVASVCKREHDKLGSGEMLRQAEDTFRHTFCVFHFIFIDIDILTFS